MPTLRNCKALLAAATALAAVLPSPVLAAQGRADRPAATVLGSVESAPRAVEVRLAQPVIWPGGVDSNSPVHWSGKTMHTFISRPLDRYTGADQFSLSFPTPSASPTISPDPTKKRWIEATWVAPSGTLYAWYHLEVFPCSGNWLAVPEIGALRSFDNGVTFEDLGVVMTAPAQDEDCNAQNGYFAGGNGDFSVILDQNQEFFYFLFGSYAGPTEGQGVATARMRRSALDNPVGSVWKYHNKAWAQPGLGGRVTPVLPAATSWVTSSPDAFWGPSVHWNTYLKSYVILLNRACCSGWNQEGIYISYSVDLANPGSISAPKKILSGGNWYAQVIGTNRSARETDKLAGQVARLYVGGESYWELVFRK